MEVVVIISIGLLGIVILWAWKKIGKIKWEMRNLDKKAKELSQKLEFQDYKIQKLKAEFPCKKIQSRECIRCREHCKYSPYYTTETPDEFVDDFLGL